MGYTLGQAEKATGKAKTTIQRAIEKGRISAAKNDNGHYDIDPSELHRVYPAVTTQRNDETVARNETQPTQQSTVTPVENKMLQTHIDLLQEQLNDKNQVIDDLRQQRDDLSQKLDTVHQTLSQQTRLLEHHQQKPTEEPVEGQEMVLAMDGSKNLSITLYDLLWAFIIGILCVVLVITTKDHWLPYADMLMK